MYLIISLYHTEFVHEHIFTKQLMHLKLIKRAQSKGFRLEVIFITRKYCNIH